jgi:Spy/CpxP family protein refolding chaperone
MNMTISPRFKIILLGLALAGLTACQQNLSPEEKSDATNFDSEELAVAGFDDFLASVEDATLDKEMGMPPVFHGGRFHHRRPQFPFGPGAHLGKILRELGVSREQMTQIRELLQAQRTCVQEPLENLRAANQDLIDAANAQRKAVLAALRNGEITREEAHAQLQAINESTRQAIRDNPDNAPFLQALCDCRNTLFAGIRALLTGTQQAQWDEWVAGLVDDWCS